MKEYYLKIGNQINGPFLLDDLKYQDIQPNTLVRIDKNGDWKHISKDGDLAFLVKINSDYKITEHNERIHKNRTKKTSTSKIVLFIVLLLMFAVSTAIYFLLSPTPN